MDRKSLDKKTITQLFTPPADSVDICLNFYKLAFPDWDRIEKIHGWPTISTATSKFIFESFIRTDRKNRAACLPGGLWLNKGFAIDDNLPDWVIDFAGVQVVYALDSAISS